MPWVGDWLKQRQAGLWLPHDKAESLERVIKERAGALEAARAVSGFSIGWIRRYESLIAHLDNFFGDQILLPELSMTGNCKRFSFYVKMLREIHDGSSKASNDFLACNGIHRDNVTILAQLQATTVLATKTSENPAAQLKLRPEVTKEMIGNLPLDDILMNQMIRAKSDTFKIPLPEFKVLPEYQPACDRFVESFPAERFPELKMFLKTCIGETEQTFNVAFHIEKFCKKNDTERIAAVWAEMEDLNSLISSQAHLTFPTLQRILEEKFNVWSPQSIGAWDRLCSTFRHFARVFHDRGLRADPESRKLVERYIGLTAEPNYSNAKKVVDETP